MLRLSRRRLLSTAAAAAGAAAFVPRAARAAWGDPSSSLPSSWPTTLGYRGFKVLEVFLYGGLSPWETLYVSGLNTTTAPTLRNLDSRIAALSWRADPECNAATQVPTGFQTQAFAGTDVALGPFTRPLWRPDLLSRLRLLCLRHNLTPHEAAIPHALTGLRLGNPRLAGMGAAVQHRFKAINTARTLPVSYVISPSAGISSDNLLSCTAAGNHGGTGQPLALVSGSVLAGSTALFDRPAFRSRRDALNFYQQQYNGRLTRAGSRVRSRVFDEYSNSLGGVFDANLLTATFPPSQTATVDGVDCAEPGTPPSGNETAQSIRLAAHLLSTGSGASSAAAYVCVIDGGLQRAAGGGGYDSHSDHINTTSTNLYNTLFSLERELYHPTYNPAGRIRLDQTMVVINTEFGRTPASPYDLGRDGRDHWPTGYVTAILGGPITSAGIAGSIGNDGVATAGASYSVTEFRAGLLLAAGIQPIQNDTYLSGDLIDSGSLSVTQTDLLHNVLGL